MELKFSFSPLKAFLLIGFLTLLTSQVLATTPDQMTRETALSFLKANWPLIALAISEILAFVPNRFTGIIQAICRIIEVFLKKKSYSNSESNLNRIRK
jgi:hypothetical protein